MILKNIIKNNQEGFSLLELLIYIAILSGFLLVITNLFFTVSTSSVREEVRSEVRQNLRFASDQMTGSVRSARSFCVDPNPDCATLSIDQGNTLDIVVNNLIERFRVADGVLQKIKSVNGGTCAVSDGCKADCVALDSDCAVENITTDVVRVSTTDPIFIKIGNTIQINLKIDYNDKDRGDYMFSESVKTTVSLRL
jgi:type II secretory pathway pseudopilin PulG